MSNYISKKHPAIINNHQIFESFESSLKLKMINLRDLKALDDYKSSNLKAPFNRIYMIQKGEVEIKSSKKQWKFLPGRVYLIPLNSNFSCFYPKGLIKSYIHFRLEFFSGQDIFENTHDCIELANLSSAKLKNMKETIDQNTAVSFVHIKATLMKWLSQFMLENKIGIENERIHYPKYKVVFDTINLNLNANLTIKRLADKMNMSQSNFSKSFSRDIGISPKGFLNKRLAEEAQHLLISSDQPISKIAYELNFEDEHYFSRFFKKNTGFSPRDYRHHHQNIN